MALTFEDCVVVVLVICVIVMKFIEYLIKYLLKQGTNATHYLFNTHHYYCLDRCVELNSIQVNLLLY